jgi:hypothetical protein
MEPESVRFMYRAINAIASGKHDPLTEQCLADAVAQELIAIRARIRIRREQQAGAHLSDAAEYRESPLSLSSRSAAVG